ncbi:MAG: ASPIC/UnbV domain-containing protein, partial [Planctomycetota bacterium]
YEYRDGGLFHEVLPRGGTVKELVESSRGAAFGDVDNDGDVDILVGNLGGDVHLLRNEIGTRGNWVMFRVLDGRGRDAVGASVRVVASGKTTWRTVQPAYSYCSSNDPRIHFGMGAADTADQVTVRWPQGGTESFGSLPAGRVHVLRQGAGP